MEEVGVERGEEGSWSREDGARRRMGGRGRAYGMRECGEQGGMRVHARQVREGGGRHGA